MQSAQARTAGEATAIAALLCVVLFLLLNPFLALFLTALMDRRWRVPPVFFIAVATLSFTLFFNAREYGIEWYPEVSTDDIPNYLGLYAGNYGLSLKDVVLRFLEAPNGHELFWHVPWWAVVNFVGASNETFIFTHYFINFLALFLALSTFSTRHLVAYTLVYLLLAPLTVDGLAHIWRQQLALSMFMAGVGLYLVRGKPFGKWLIYLSPLMHVSVIFFVIVFVVFKLIRTLNGFKNKLVFSLLLFAMMAAIPPLSSAAVALLDSIGIQRLMAFFEGYGTNVVRIYLLISLYALPMLLVFYFLRNDDANHLAMILCFAVFSIVLALPGANGIYDRLLMFSLSFLGLFFYRALQQNFAAAWQIPAMIVIFAIGMFRLYLPTQEQSGVMYFLAFGRAFDPMMGIVKLLTLV